jgi:spore coat polysaccharide biosynthesis predicted glycosyltransferase SpsG
MTKVFILTEGGSRGGFGHVTRCASLYQAFEEQGIKPQLLINGDDFLVPVVQGQNYLIFNWLERQNELFRVISGADLVVLDSYKADLSFYERVSGAARTPVYFDDMLRLDYPRGIVVNGAIGAEDLPYPEKSNIRYLLGIRYFPLRREFWGAPEKQIKEKVEVVLVTFGGSDERNLTPRVLKYLSEYDPHLVKIVIVGSGFENDTEILKVADSKTRLVCNPDGHTLKKEMMGSDVAISAAGQTLYELAYLGVPTLAVQVIENQANNINGLRRVGAILYAGSWEEERTDPNIPVSIKKMEDVQLREKMAGIGRKLIDANGSRNIVKEILSM